MTLILNGTNGITDVNGTAAAPAITGTDTDTGVFFGTNTVSLSTNGTERLQVDSSGNLGLGVTPSAWDTGGSTKALQVSTSTTIAETYGRTVVAQNWYNSSTGDKYITNGYASRHLQYQGQHQWYTAPSGTAGNAITFTQAMTLDASGNLLVGQTSGDSYAGYRVLTVGSSNGIIQAYDGSVKTAMVSNNSGYGLIGTRTNHGVAFITNDVVRTFIDTSGVLCVGSTSNTWAVAGAIKTVGITSHAGQSGAYQNNGINLEWRAGALRIWVDTTDLGTVQFASDYRIKKDIATQTLPALDRIAQLRPVTFEFGDYGDLFKGDNVAREGFIAHEVAEVIPSAVDGEKDCENQIQSLRLDALCSVMVKAIQEQQAIITQLQADVQALKGNA